MVGLNTIVSRNVLMLLRKDGKKQSDLADALGVSMHDVSDMLYGARMIPVKELQRMADYFHVSKESLMQPSANATYDDALHAIMDEVKTESAKKSLEIADEIADMVLFYARVRDNAEKMQQVWEA